MFLALMGGIIIIVSCGSDSGSVGTLIGGLMMVILGVALSTVFSEQCRAHANWRKHWSEK